MMRVSVRITPEKLGPYLITAHGKDWSDRADAQADLCLHWAHVRFVGFVMRWLILISPLEVHSRAQSFKASLA